MARPERFIFESRFFLKYEQSRLATFLDWPRSYLLDPKELAASGFYYFKKSDRCACIFCGKLIGAWEVGDTAASEHQRHSPQCEFVRGLPVGNVPIAHSDILDKIYLEGEDSPIYNFAYEASCQFFFVSSEYENFQCRVESFYKHGWPDKVRIRPEELAEAGFFYHKSAISDHAACFDCGYGLRNWNESHDPWTEHARYYPNCGYVLKVKGRDFIEKVRAERGGEFIPLKKSSGVFKKLTEKQLDALMESDEIRFVRKKIGIAGDALLRDILRKRIESRGLPFDNCDEIWTQIPKFLVNPPKIKRRISQ